MKKVIKSMGGKIPCLYADMLSHSGAILQAWAGEFAVAC